MNKLIFLCCALVVTPGLARQYTIDWHQIGGGGGVSTNGVYAIAGAIGQSDAGATMTGGAYSLTGGFWSLIAVVPTAGLPNLAITHAGSSVIVSWPNTASATLQQNNNLALPAGWTKSSYAISAGNGTNSITITPPPAISSSAWPVPEQIQ